VKKLCKETSCVRGPEREGAAGWEEDDTVSL